MNAVSRVFGEDKSFGCLFHYVKAMLLHISKSFPLLHHAYHNKEKDIYKWVRMICALPLLHRDDVHKIWPTLKQFNKLSKKFHKEAGLFIRYMENEWISKPGNRWNFHRLLRTRTSNAAEAFHSSINRDPLSSTHPALENFISFMQQLTSEIDSRIYKISNGLSPFKRRNQLYETVDDKLTQCIDEFENWKNNDHPEREDLIEGSKHYLSRLSYLLLQMSEWGLTRKEEKVGLYE